MTARIAIGNGESQIIGLTKEGYQGLKKALGYTVNNGRMKFGFKIVNGRRVKTRVPMREFKSLLDRKGRFPTGLLSRAAAFLDKKKIDCTFDDTRVVPSLHSLAEAFEVQKDDFVPLQWQVDAAKAALDAYRGILAAPTGTGKSYLACMILLAFGVKSFICVPSLGLKGQLTDSINDLFGPMTAGPLVRGKAVFPVTVENVDALKPTHDLSGVDLLLIDEYHHSAATTYRKLSVTLWKDIYWRFGLTATPFRSRSEEGILMASIVSDIAYRLTYEDAVRQGLIVPMRVFYVEAPKPDGKMKTHTNYHNAYQDLVVNNANAHKLVAGLAEKLYAKQDSSLVLCRQIDHGLAVQKILDDNGIEVPFAEGTSDLKDHDIRNFCMQNEWVLIGTVGVLGEGVDTKPAVWVIIAGAGKAKVQLMQNLGRIFRTYPGKTMGYAIILKYSGNKWLENHFNETVKTVWEEYGLRVERLPMELLTA